MNKKTQSGGRLPVAEVASFGEKFAAQLFAGRKGHGGAPISYIRFTQEDLARVISTAYDEGARTATAKANSKA